MKLSNLIRIAARSLGKNKLRSFLTMLGIIIGVGSVIAMLAVGQGSKENIEKSIASLGSNVIMVMPGAASSGGVRTEAGSSQKLTLEDAAAISKNCPSVKYTTPLVRTSVQAIASGQNWRTSVYGVYPDYFDIRTLTAYSGNFFEMNEDRSAAKVCVIGQTTVTNLFGENADPVGSFIRLNNIPFKVIGVLDKKGQNAFGQDQDDIVIAPFSTVQKRMMAVPYIQQILISAQSEDDIEAASAEISSLLSERHKIGMNQEPDFTIRTQSEIASAFTSTSKVMTGLLATIASISLLVGGIGIMNIMLVSVTERTREIGIRLAVGARGMDVLLQFLIEAILLSFVGGLIGILIGMGASWLVADLMGWPVSVTLDSIILSFLFSTAIGVFFGWYPARKAARLNPIDALRYE